MRTSHHDSSQDFKFEPREPVRFMHKSNGHDHQLCENGTRIRLSLLRILFWYGFFSLGIVGYKPIGKVCFRMGSDPILCLRVVYFDNVCSHTTMIFQNRSTSIAIFPFVFGSGIYCTQRQSACYIAWYVLHIRQKHRFRQDPRFSAKLRTGWSATWDT